jgi:hypothetical protein
LVNGALGENPEPVPIRELQPHDLLLRALTKKVWLEGLHEAFMLRPDETGLSVCFDCLPAECITILDLNCLSGVANLSVNGVTALDLTVTPDEPHHALIEGIPHKEENADRAEWLASQLAAITAVIDRTRRKRPAERG